MSDVIRFTNGYIALPDGTVSLSAYPSLLARMSSLTMPQCTRTDLYVSPSTHLIVSPQKHFYTSHLSPYRNIDLGGNLLSPGLIDVQINGAYGVDFSELNTEDVDGGEKRYLDGLDKVAKRIVETGCTSFVPTIITQKEELYSKVDPYIPTFSKGFKRIKSDVVTTITST